MPRPLAPSEKSLIRWMLEHGHPEARAFLPQLEQVSVTDWQCPCGCPSVFVFEKRGFLAGLEVYGLSGDAPKMLPPHDILRPFEANILKS
jgi:hypothetical protein